jgi:hypothetical protein
MHPVEEKRLRGSSLDAHPTRRHQSHVLKTPAGSTAPYLDRAEAISSRKQQDEFAAAIPLIGGLRAARIGGARFSPTDRVDAVG